MANGSPVPNPNDPVQVVRAWLSNLFGEDLPEEKDSSARVEDTAAAQELYKNPYQNQAPSHSIEPSAKTKKPKSAGIATKLPSRTILGETRSPTMMSQPSPYSGPSTPYLRIPTQNDQMIPGPPSVESEVTTPGLYYPGAKGRFLEGAPSLVPYGQPLSQPGEVTPPKGNEQNTEDVEKDNPDVVSYMDQLRGLLSQDQKAEIDLGPLIAWTDSISGNNVLRGYQKPKTKDQLKSERLELAAKLAAISERQEYHKGSLAKDAKKRAELKAAIDDWNEKNPDNLINPFTGTAFKSGDDWMNTIGKAYALEGIKGGAAKQKKDEADTYIAEWKKQNPGKKPEPYWDGNGISWTKEPRAASSGKSSAAASKPIYPSTAELNSTAEGTFASWYKRSYNKRDPRDRDILATIKSVYTKALEDAKKDKANYYELAEKRLGEFLAENKRKNAEAKAKEQKPSEKGWLDSLGDKIKEMGF